jgi:hypothetical protein
LDDPLVHHLLADTSATTDLHRKMQLGRLPLIDFFEEIVLEIRRLPDLEVRDPDGDLRVAFARWDQIRAGVRTESSEAGLPVL